MDQFMDVCMYVHVSMGGWMNGQMYQWVHGLMDDDDGWKDGWMEGFMDVCMYQFVDGWMDIWMYGWMYRWVDGYMHEWTSVLKLYNNFCHCLNF